MILRSILYSDYNQLEQEISESEKGNEDGIEVRLDHRPSGKLNLRCLQNYHKFKLLTLKNDAAELILSEPDLAHIFDMIDIDYFFYKEHSDLLEYLNDRLIISIHSGSKGKIYRMISDPKIIDKRLKIVITKGSLKDYKRLNNFLPERNDITFFLTGKRNNITRIKCIKEDKLNYSYSSKKTAPGQFSINEAVQIRDKDVYGLVGNPLHKSLSRIIYNHAFKLLNLNAIYINFEIRKTDLRDFLEIARSSGVKGLNFTIPFKIEASEILTGKREPINFCKFGKTEEVRNTDLEAILKLVEKLNHERVLIFGYGASAVTSFKAFQSSEIFITGRNYEKLKKFSLTYGVPILDHKGYFDILINATPLGMYSQDSIPQIIADSRFDTIIDLPYSRNGTQFQLFANQNGYRYISGLEILALQASLNMKYWFGKNLDYRQVMKFISEEMHDGNN